VVITGERLKGRRRKELKKRGREAAESEIKGNQTSERDRAEE
jgi:hypothetical protein